MSSVPVSFIYHPAVLRHDTGPGHPERKERLEHLLGHLMGRDLWPRIRHLRPEGASRAQLCDAHREKYVDWVERSIREGVALLDEGDTRVCTESWNAALISAGGVLLAVETACSGDRGHAFSAGRPPPHHPE